MGEGFKNSITSIFEKKPKPLYSSGAVSVERFTDAKKERPKSQALAEAYPELYAFLMKNESAKKFNVGIIHLDGNGAISEKFASTSKSPLGVLNALKETVHSDLIALAKKVKENPSSELAKIDFFTAYSRLANHEAIAKEFGFETFDIDNDEVKFDESNNKQTKRTYEALSATKPIKDLNTLVNKRPAKIGLMSKATLLALLEKESNSRS